MTLSIKAVVLNWGDRFPQERNNKIPEGCKPLHTLQPQVFEHLLQLILS